MVFSGFEDVSKAFRGDIVEVKNMKSPPEGVITVSKALCWMFDVKPKKVTAEDGRTKAQRHGLSIVFPSHVHCFSMVFHGFYGFFYGFYFSMVFGPETAVSRPFRGVSHVFGRSTTIGSRPRRASGAPSAQFPFIKSS